MKEVLILDLYSEVKNLSMTDLGIINDIRTDQLFPDICKTRSVCSLCQWCIFERDLRNNSASSRLISFDRIWCRLSKGLVTIRKKVREYVKKTKFSSFLFCLQTDEM